MTAKKVFYLLTAALVLTIIGGSWAYVSYHQQLDAQSKHIQTKKAELAASEDRLQLALRASTKFAELRDVNDIIGNILPNSKAQSDIVADVTALANNSGVSLKSINFNSSDLNSDQSFSQTIESKYSSLRALPVTVTVDASYSQLLEFLSEIESNQRKITVESLSINPAGGGKLETSLVINFYVRTTNG